MSRYSFLPDDFYEWPVDERRIFLQENADEVKEETFYKPLAQVDRSGLKDTLSTVSIDLSNQQEEYDQVKEHWREEVIKPLKQQRKETIDKLKTGTEKVTGKVMYIRDYENRRVVKMAEDGTQIEARPMRANERQTTTQSNIRSLHSSTT